MADWDADSPRLQENLARALRLARDHAQARQRPTFEQARQWHSVIMGGLKAPDAAWVGRFRGEAGMEDIGVAIGPAMGTDPGKVNGELREFEERLQEAVAFLDGKIPTGEVTTDESLEAVLVLMSWVHGEWARIHPFANGNGRIARIWASWVAMRYGIPPIVRLRPRPTGSSYAAAAAASMHGKYEDMVPVFQQMLEEQLGDG